MALRPSHFGRFALIESLERTFESLSPMSKTLPRDGSYICGSARNADFGGDTGRYLRLAAVDQAPANPGHGDAQIVR